jgi:hypothetical protein
LSSRLDARKRLRSSEPIKIRSRHLRNSSGVDDYDRSGGGGRTLNIAFELELETLVEKFIEKRILVT